MCTVCGRVCVCIRYTQWGCAALLLRPLPSFLLLKSPFLHFCKAGVGGPGDNVCIVRTERSEKEDGKEISDWLHDTLHLLRNKNKNRAKMFTAPSGKRSSYTASGTGSI